MKAYKRNKQICALFLVMAMIVGLVSTTPVIHAKEETYTAHTIQAGDSYIENPLKGFVPYNYGTMSFPHSMEWFYIAVNEVQTGMNEFDWSALEEKLDDVASRGNQAVMRFYYDYPSFETGVPQFLINQGLEMKYYNEPIDLGGDGYAPDYENPIFRQSMQNFIAAFGEQYDGDGRLAYVTMGLLGFWGEWHNWPYDEDTSDGKADWSISKEVYKEVLDSFDAAFDVTPLCVREPKGGIEYSGYDIGFHDDSFGYATLSVSSGGQSWSFMQKMFNFNLHNKWQEECIGGEVYPPSQYDIFSGKEPDGSFQDWDTCMSEAHATWMLNNAIRDYFGTNYENALKAAASLGYDLQVSTAYFHDTQSEDSLYLKVDMKNIGCAPFYYDHTVWPVEIGVKQGNNLIKSWRTEWDLCDVPADGSNVSFEHVIENHGLSEGSYSIGIKVINPLRNGKILGFANESQGSDGWLELGTICVTKNNEDNSTEEGSMEEKTTEESTTEESSTEEKTTEESTTEESSTEEKTTEESTTEESSTEEKTTEESSTEEGSTEEKTTEENTTEESSTEEKTTEENSTEENEKEDISKDEELQEAKESLFTVIESAETLLETDYTAESWKAFTEALSDANKILNNKEASVEEVEAVLNKLRTAQQNLEKEDTMIPMEPDENQTPNVPDSNPPQTDTDVEDETNDETVVKPTVKWNVSYKTVPLQLKNSKGKVNKTKALQPVGLQQGDSVLSYSSSKTKVATVKKDSKGKLTITPKKVGKTKIKVKTKYGATASITLKVQKKAVKVNNISINNVKKNKITLKKGKTFKLKVTKKYITALDKVTYKSNRTKIATVSSSGKIKAKKKGTARITIKCGMKKKVITVKVTN